MCTEREQHEPLEAVVRDAHRHVPVVDYREIGNAQQVVPHVSAGGASVGGALSPQAICQNGPMNHKRA